MVGRRLVSECAGWSLRLPLLAGLWPVDPWRSAPSPQVGAGYDARSTDGTAAEKGCADLVAVKDWTFLLGPGFVVGVGNGLMLGYLMYRSGLVPQRMAMLGLVGGPLICISGAAVLFGAIEQGSAWQGIATIPEFIWELSLGIYLIAKGFKSSPILSGDVRQTGVVDGPPIPAVAAR
jgi:hypothetical protein